MFLVNATPARIETLEKRFTELHQRTLLEMTESGVPVDKFFNTLLMLPFAFRKEYESTIQGMLQATTEENISTNVVSAKHFRQLSPLFVFIDYSLLKHIIDKFGSAMLNKDMLTYVYDVKVFMRETTVGDLMEHWPGHEVPHLNRMYSKLIVQFKDDPQTFTLEKVDRFRRRFCSYVRLSEFVCGLISFEPSESFFAVWIIPTAIAPQLTEAISKIDEEFFQEEHVLAVAVQLYQYGENETTSTSSIVRKKFNFDKSRPTLELYKDEVLGTGAYGIVCKAKYGHFTCSAKFCHPIIKSDVNYERFRKECSLLRALRHPNIVQYFGVGQDPDSGDPVLLMEMLDGDLTQFLKTSTSGLSLCIEVNICHDVAQALAYLHSNRIVHCNLSSNNVLLMGNALKAKICGFGSATVDPNSQQQLTAFPGALPYMPPEAMTDDPKYNEKLDSFSFGVLTVQILTLLYPQPGSRQEHIEKIVTEHPLRKTALDCLEFEASSRPSAIRLCAAMEEVKESQAYKDSETQAAAPERLQLAPASTSTDEDSNLDDAASAQKPEIQDKPQISGQLQGERHTNREELEKELAHYKEQCTQLKEQQARERERLQRLQGQSSCVCM